jgi:hypothetical protein
VDPRAQESNSKGPGKTLICRSRDQKPGQPLLITGCLSTAGAVALGGLYLFRLSFRFRFFFGERYGSYYCGVNADADHGRLMISSVSCTIRLGLRQVV